MMNVSPRGRRSSALLAAVVLLATVFAAVNAGGAAALGEQCSGKNAGGLGAFLQTRAQVRWGSANELGFNGSSQPSACSGSQGTGGKPAVSYVPVSSAAALRAWGAEDTILHAKEFEIPVNFLASDIAPAGPANGEGVTMLDKMRKALGSDVVVVPVTQTAIAIVANPPSLPAHPTCTVPRISATQLQKVFSGEIKNWRQLAAASDSALGGDCDQAITRVVREESAGTTYQFKHYLSQVNSTGLPCTGKEQRTWAQLQAPFGGESPANVEWPRNSGCQEGEVPVTAVSTGNGEGEIGPLEYVNENRGTITYASLPEAQDKAPERVIDVNNGAKFVSPATEGGAANCSDAKYPLPEGFEKGVNVDWSQVYGSDPKIGETAKNAYPICTLSWDLAPANAAGLFGGKVATTLRDYLRFVVDPSAGQASVRSIGYQDLPPYVQEAAGLAINQIGGEEKEEEPEEEEEGGGGGSSTGTVLCRTQPEEAGGTLFCPPGEGFSGTVSGQLTPKTTATFEFPGAGEEGSIVCKGGHLFGSFEEDGTSSGSGLQYLIFDYCNNPFWGSPEAKVALEGTPYDASRFVYLGTLAPQGAFVVAKKGGGQVVLRVYGSGGPCTYLPTFLSGQTVNGIIEKSPTELIMQGRWQLAEGPEGECPPQLQQSSQLSVTGGEEGPLFVAGE